MGYKYFTKGLNGKFAWTMEVQEDDMEVQEEAVLSFIPVHPAHVFTKYTKTHVRAITSSTPTFTSCTPLFFHNIMLPFAKY